jgi:signal peptidase I
MTQRLPPTPSIPPQQDATQPSEPPPKPAHPLIRFWRSIRSLVIMIAVLFAVRSSIADWNDVPTGSMIPTILDGDRIFVNKLAYDLKIPFTLYRIGHPWAGPQRGDVVVFFSPDDGTRLVKRCVAVGGDTIQVVDDHLIINGQPIQYGPADPKLTTHAPLDFKTFDYETETLGTHVHLIQKYTDSFLSNPFNHINPYMVRDHRNYGPETVKKDTFFMMGDNRDNSRDSRFFTAGPFVPRHLIVGRATDVVISLDLDHYWIPRWSRFFTKLP